jgi:hypothetical protein
VCCMNPTPESVLCPSGVGLHYQQALGEQWSLAAATAAAATAAAFCL